VTHFCGFVVVPDCLGEHEDEVLAYLETILEPYSLQRETPIRSEECHCLGQEARKRADLRAQKEVDYDALRKSFSTLHQATWEAMAQDGRLEDIWDMQERLWPEHFQPWIEARERILESDPMKEAPSPSCLLCGGLGHYETERNPMGRWDYWLVGGRFDGVICGTWHPDVSRYEHGAIANNLKRVHQMRTQLWELIKLTPDKLVIPQAIVLGEKWYEFEDTQAPEWVGDLGRRRRWRKRATDMLMDAPDNDWVIACDMHS